ncbi:hypothetical protein ACA910_007789 [Epithemia clementina (nom. ined.)]
MCVGRGMQSNTLKEILDSTSRGPTCAAPTNEAEDVQWSKLDWSQVRAPMGLPSVFSNTEFVRRTLTDQEIGSLLDLPAEIVKGGDVLQLREWIGGSTVPFKTRVEILRRLWTWSSRGYAEHPQIHLMRLENQLARIEDKSVWSKCLEVSPLNSDITTWASTKAAKADDAEVPEYIWNDWIRSGLSKTWSDLEFSKLVHGFRCGLHRYWVRKVTKEFWSWWRQKYPTHGARQKEDAQLSYRAGRSAVRHAQKSSWWDWDDGSSPFFWRFPLEWQAEMRDGLAPKWIGPKPRYTARQRNHADPSV